MAYPSIANYTVVDKIGEGGFGIIYQAIQVNTGQQVALKVLKTDPDTTPDPQQTQHRKARFAREIQLCAQLRHPHIVQLLDQGETQEQAPFAVFEYVEGINLKQYILQNEELSAQTTELLMGQILDALVCAHGQGIVHRDLKPQNIMVAQTGAAPHIKVLDFGIGAFTHEYRPQDYKSLTLTKEMVGTPSYSAPEQLRGEPPTTKSDLYAWGLILLECLTGRTVMEGNSLAEIFKQQLDNVNVALPAAIIGHDLAPLLRRVLDKNPRTRAGDAAKLYEEYKEINFNTIVGKIAKTTAETYIEEEECTLDSDLVLVQGQTSKRQITVMCIQLSLQLPQDCVIEPELLDTLQKDQLNSCSDTVIRYGGYIKGTLGNCMMAYFGYPQVSDNAARRAGRTALELISQTQKRASLLEVLHGISLDVRISLHADEVLIRQNQAPEGLTPDVAFNLLREAPPQSVWVSDTTKQLLDPYLEFEVTNQYKFANTTQPIQVHALVGERQTEAMSFLRPWSANRQMIGRDGEKQQVLDLWKKVKTGQGLSTLISGQAGIGKSKLTYEAKKQLRSDGFVVRECRCLPEQSNNALFPFFDMLRKHWGGQEGEESGGNIGLLEEVLSEIKSDVSITLPILCSWLSIPLSETYGAPQEAPEKQKEILLDTLEQLILNIAKGAPFLLIVEDLHWLDPTSQEFLERLLAKLEQHNFLLLMTTRPHFTPGWVHNHLTTIQLQPLNKGFIQHMIQGVLGDTPVDDKVVNYVAERADGIPLFIEELTHMLEEQNYLILQNDTYQLDEAQNAEDVPVTLKDLLNTRLGRLGLAKETAQLAATIGRNFDYNLLVSASLRDEASIQADLDELMNADLVYRQRRVQGESYIFRHALIRDAAYEGMPKAAQKDTHGRIATSLATEFPEIAEENPFEVARHFAGSEQFEQASEYGVKMVEKQVNNSSNEEAVSTGDWVLEQVNAIATEEIRLDKEFDVLNTLFSAVMAVGGYGSDQLITLSNRLREIAELLSQEDAALESHTQEKQQERKEIIWKNDWILFLNAHYKPERAKALKLGTTLLENARQMNNREKEMVVLGQYAQCFLKDGHHADSVQYFKQAIDLYDEAKDNDQDIIKKYGTHPKAYGLSLIAQPLLHLGGLKEAFEHLDEGAVYAENIGNETGIAFSYILQALIMAFCENEKGIENLIKTFEHKHQDKTESQGYFLQYLYIFEYYRLRQVDKAEDMVQMIYDSGQLFAISWYVIFLIKIHLDKGNISRAIELAERTHRHNLENDIHGSTGFVKKTLAMCYYAQDQKLTPRIDQLLRESLTYAEEQKAHFFGLDTLVYHIELLQKEGNQEERVRQALMPKLQTLVQKLSEVNDLENHLELKDAWSQYNKALAFIEKLMPQDQALV
ncbi:MAG TPA: TOMM system kinase/cyclase fusion protein [Microscillaceae bacterium]|nr:TOMM system kinase/cyclase fusion protein [Microscillaceae bacterium]